LGCLFDGLGVNLDKKKINLVLQHFKVDYFVTGEEGSREDLG
jgi:hypothetical protein